MRSVILRDGRWLGKAGMRDSCGKSIIFFSEVHVPLPPDIPTRLYNAPFAVVGEYTPYELGFNQSRFHLARLTLASRC